SPFATALLKNLVVPGLDVRLAFGRVRDEVLRLTANKQEPFVYGSLGGEGLPLVPASARPVVQAKVEGTSDVKADYELAERIRTKQAWDFFLSSHTEGLYADFARAQIAKLNEAAAPPQRSPEVARELVPRQQAPSANTAALILSAQRELRRLGCFKGEEDGRL